MWVAGSVRAAGVGMVLFALALTACGPSDAPSVPEPVAPEPVAPEPVEARPVSHHADVRAPQTKATYEPGCVTLTAPDFEPTEVGCSSTVTAVLRNTCSVPVFLYGFETFGGTGSPERCDSPGACWEFFLADYDPIIPATGLNLAPGASVSATMRYRPLDLVGPDTGWLGANMRHDDTQLHVGAIVTGTAIPRAQIMESFSKTPLSRTDLLIVVDTSPSMVPRMTEVREGLRTLLDPDGRNVSRSVDLHVGVVTADPPRGGLVPHPESGARYFTERTPELGMRVDEIIASLEGAGSGPSQPLAAAAAAVLPARSLAPSINGGFSRSEAFLSVLVFTDQPDQSPDSVKDLVERMRDTRTRSNGVNITVVGPFSEACGIADDGRLAQAASLTWGEDLHSICDPEWEAPFLQVGSNGSAVRSERALNSVPMEGAAMVVEAELPDGSRFLLSPDEWTYSPVSNSISIRDFWDHPWDTTYRVSFTPAYCW